MISIEQKVSRWHFRVAALSAVILLISALVFIYEARSKTSSVIDLTFNKVISLVAQRALLTSDTGMFKDIGNVFISAGVIDSIELFDKSKITIISLPEYSQKRMFPSYQRYVELKTQGREQLNVDGQFNEETGSEQTLGYIGYSESNNIIYTFIGITGVSIALLLVVIASIFISSVQFLKRFVISPISAFRQQISRIGNGEYEINISDSELIELNELKTEIIKVGNNLENKERELKNSNSELQLAYANADRKIVSTIHLLESVMPLVEHVLSDLDKYSNALTNTMGGNAFGRFYSDIRLISNAVAWAALPDGKFRRKNRIVQISKIFEIDFGAIAPLIRYEKYNVEHFADKYTYIDDSRIHIAVIGMIKCLQMYNAESSFHVAARLEQASDANVLLTVEATISHQLRDFELNELQGFFQNKIAKMQGKDMELCSMIKSYCDSLEAILSFRKVPKSHTRATLELEIPLFSSSDDKEIIKLQEMDVEKTILVSSLQTHHKYANSFSTSKNKVIVIYPQQISSLNLALYRACFIDAANVRAAVEIAERIDSAYVPTESLTGKMIKIAIVHAELNQEEITSMLNIGIHEIINAAEEPLDATLLENALARSTRSIFNFSINPD